MTLKIGGLFHVISWVIIVIIIIVVVAVVVVTIIIITVVVIQINFRCSTHRMLMGYVVFFSIIALNC